VDMRRRVIAKVESGASRRAAAKELRLAPARRSSGSSAFGRRVAVRPSRGREYRRSRSARTWCGRAGAGCESRTYLISPIWSLSTRPPTIPDAAALRPLPARRALDRSRAARALEDHNFCRRTSSKRHARAGTVDGSITDAKFLAYVKQCLAPTLKRKDIVVIDNLPAHRAPGIHEAIEARGATFRYLPHYSHDLNPIEMPLSKLKVQGGRNAQFLACADESAGSGHPNRPRSAQLFQARRV
jgi:transposase